jgi:hypothetical protein
LVSHVRSQRHSFSSEAAAPLFRRFQSHHCRVIPEADIFCIIVPSAEVSDRICKMIQRACVLSG